jgi:translation initiation factor IF-2
VPRRSGTAFEPAPVRNGLHPEPIPVSDHRVAGHFQPADAGRRPRLLPGEVRPEQPVPGGGGGCRRRRGGGAGQGSLRGNAGAARAGGALVRGTAPDRAAGIRRGSPDRTRTRARVVAHPGAAASGCGRAGRGERRVGDGAEFAAAPRGAGEGRTGAHRRGVDLQPGEPGPVRDQRGGGCRQVRGGGGGFRPRGGASGARGADGGGAGEGFEADHGGDAGFAEDHAGPGPGARRKLDGHRRPGILHPLSPGRPAGHLRGRAARGEDLSDCREPDALCVAAGGQPESRRGHRGRGGALGGHQVHPVERPCACW